MSLSAFKEKILSEATASAENISRKNTLLIQEERERASAELRTLEEAVVTAAKLEAKSITRSIHQQAQLAGRSLVLIAKQEELQKTKRAFLDSVEKMSEKDKKKIHKSLLRLVPEKKGEVVSTKDEMGFIFRGDDFEMNLTFSYLIDTIFWKYRSELAKELFI